MSKVFNVHYVVHQHVTVGFLGFDELVQHGAQRVRMMLEISVKAVPNGRDRKSLVVHDGRPEIRQHGRAVLTLIFVVMTCDKVIYFRQKGSGLVQGYPLYFEQN